MKKKYFLILLPFVLFLIFVAYNSGWFASEKSNPLFSYDSKKMESIKLEMNSLNSPIRPKIVTIYNYLSDTLTDQEEADIISIFEESKQDSTFELLISDLHLLELLQLLSKKWDEAYLNRTKPNKFQKLVQQLIGKSTHSNLSNKYIFNDLFNCLFSYSALSEQTGKYIFNGLLQHQSIENVGTGTQILFTMLVNKHYTSLSESTKNLARIVLEKQIGNPSQNAIIDVGRRKLGMKD